MPALREYHVTVNGTATTMQLTEKQAELLGAIPVDGPQPEGTDASAVPAKARLDVDNKARTARRV